MSTNKKLLIILLSIIYTLCLGINIWYLLVLNIGEKKVVSDTYEVGVQTITKVDGTEESKYFIEVNYMADMFEIKFNYLLDENQTAFYSQGLQFLPDENGEMTFHYRRNPDTRVLHSTSGWWFTYKEVYNQYVDGALWGSHQYNYMSGNDYKDCLDSTNPISNDSFFKIQIGDEIYGMKFKGHNVGFNQTNYTNVTDQISSPSYTMELWDVRNYYSADFVYFAELLYNSCATLENGTNHAIAFEFGDLFEYYEYNDDGVYSTKAVSIDKASSIERAIKSYYSILVHKNENKVSKSSDSIFNCVAGNTGWNMSEDIVSEDYFIGRTISNVTILDFDFVNIAGNSYALKLNERYLNYVHDISDKIVLDVLIDLDYFKENNYEFKGFTADSGLNNFNVLQCRTAETINGNIVYTGVLYA